MLTAAEARELTNNFGERDKAQEYRRTRLQGYLTVIKKQASSGYSDIVIHIQKDFLKRYIIEELKKLGYTVKHIWFTDEYIISW